LFYVIEHADFDLATDSKVQRHTKVLMNLSTTHYHSTRSVLEDALIFATQVLNHLVHNLDFNMTCFQIVNMLANSHLLSGNDLVCDTWVAWVNNITNVRQTLGKLTTAEQTCYHCSAEGILALH
jgi:hypothetical protein